MYAIRSYYVQRRPEKALRWDLSGITALDDAGAVWLARALRSAEQIDVSPRYRTMLTVITSYSIHYTKLYELPEGEKRIALTRAHLEEDAGKSLHEDFHGIV